MGGDQRGIEVDDQRDRSRRVVIGGVHPRQRPHPGPGRGPGGVDRRQRRGCIRGQGRDRPGHRQIRRDGSVDPGFGAQHRHVGEAVTAQSEGNGQVENHPARVVDRPRAPPQGQPGTGPAVHTRRPDGLRQQHPTGPPLQPTPTPRLPQDAGTTGYASSPGRCSFNLVGPDCRKPNLPSSGAPSSPRRDPVSAHPRKPRADGRAWVWSAPSEPLLRCRVTGAVWTGSRWAVRCRSSGHSHHRGAAVM